MLTGILEPTSGNAVVLSHDTWQDWGRVQKLIGLCPQQSTLFDCLTPREHLKLYGMLKGSMDSQDLSKDVEM